jgi:hypothetical protein
MKKITQIALFITLCAVSGCVGNKAYHVSYDKHGQPIVEPVRNEEILGQQFDPTNTPKMRRTRFAYRLAFIEFDDRGEMFDRGQLDQVLTAIQDVKNMAIQQSQDARKEAQSNGVACPEDKNHVLRPVVAVFVHGWKNNASESSGNVWGFRQLLGGFAHDLSQTICPTQHSQPAPVLGIYIGWRGAVLSPPLLKELTFYDRRDKSQNLPNAHMVEVLIKIMRAAKGADYQENTISILIGHSFGGAVLETALTQTLENLIVEAPAHNEIHWPANLIVFVNEAQQATQSYQLIESLIENVDPRPHCTCPSDQASSPTPQVAPIVSITSTGDAATGVAFPLAQGLNRPFNSLRTYPRPNRLGLSRQTPMYLKTTAHLTEFQSHLFGENSDSNVHEALNLCKPAYEIDMQSFLGPEKHFFVVERPGAPNRTPYWVMQMPASIVPDHSTIFGPEFRHVLIALLYGRALGGAALRTQKADHPKP